MPIDSVSSGRPVARSALEQLAQRADAARAAPRVRRRARESPSGRAARSRGSAATALRQRQRVVGRDAALGRLAADVDLQADLQRRQRRRAAARSGARRSSGGRRCTQSKRSATTRVLLLCSGPIRCHSSRRAQVGERGDLLERFLHVVLAEAALAGGVRLAHRVGAEGLAHREQRDALHGASGGRASACDARVHAVRACLRSLRIIVATSQARRQCLLPRTDPALTSGRSMDITELLAFVGQEQGLRPAPVGRPAADDPRARRRAPHQRRRRWSTRTCTPWCTTS